MKTFLELLDEAGMQALPLINIYGDIETVEVEVVGEGGAVTLVFDSEGRLKDICENRGA